MIGEVPEHKKKRIDLFLYEEGDTVIAKYPSVSKPDNLDDGIDYKEIQTIVRAEESDLGDMIAQIIYFESNPKVPHVAKWFSPIGETAKQMEEIAKVDENVKKEVSRSKKNRPTIKLPTSAKPPIKKEKR